MRLKIGLVGDDTGHNFTFTSPQPVAYNEREKFKKELTTILGRNRNGPTSDPSARAPVTAFTAPPQLPSTPASHVPPSRPPLPASRPSTSRAASVSSDQRGTPVILGNDPAADFRLRKTVLVSNPDLGALHRELVIGGQITEAEFWDGREVRHAPAVVSLPDTSHSSIFSSRKLHPKASGKASQDNW